MLSEPQNRKPDPMYMHDSQDQFSKRISHTCIKFIYKYRNKIGENVSIKQYQAPIVSMRTPGKVLEAY